MLGRRDELLLLENLYAANSLQIALLEGGKGLGKTTLVKEFSKRKRSFYFAARDNIEKFNQKALFEEACLQGFGNNGRAVDWRDALEYIFKAALGEKIIFIIDNAQLLESAFPSFWRAFQSLTESYRCRLRLLVVFVGEGTEKLSERLAGYRNIITHLRLELLRFHETLQYFAGLENEDKVLLYGITGGKPLYVKQVDTGLSLKDNLLKLFYNENSELLYFGEKLLAEKLRQPHIYHAILYAVACGALRMKEIAEAIGMEDNKTSKYVNALVQLGFLRRMTPVSENNTAQCKNVCYLFADNMLYFWYKFVYPHISAIALGLGHVVLKNKILPCLQQYSAKVFLDVCYQHCLALKARGNFSIAFERLGYIWPRGGTLPDFRLAAYAPGCACYMRCVWSRTKVDLDAIVSLQEEYGDGGVNDYYVIFSRKGFTDKALASDARLKNVRLISLRYFT